MTTGLVRRGDRPRRFRAHKGTPCTWSPQGGEGLGTRGTRAGGLVIDSYQPMLTGPSSGDRGREQVTADQVQAQPPSSQLSPLKMAQATAGRKAGPERKEGTGVDEKGPRLQEPRPQPTRSHRGSELNLAKTRSRGAMGGAQGRTALMGMRPPPAAPATLGERRVGSRAWAAPWVCAVLPPSPPL